MKLINVFSWRRRRDDDLREEIASHLAMATQDRVADGQDPRSAHFAARKEFGNITLTREATRLSWGGIWIDRLLHVWRDMAYAVRLLARSPAYSLVVTAVLALGIGVNLLSFGLFQALALTPLAGVRDSASLQFIVARTSSGRDVALSYREYRHLRDQARSFQDLAGSYLQGWTLGRGADARVVFGELVSGNYFDVLGVGAQLGRTLRQSDDVVTAPPVAVVSDSLWRRELGADPAAVGRTIRVGRIDLTVVGVAAPEFHGAVPGLATELFIPYVMRPDGLGGSDASDWLYDTDTPWVHAFGRLHPGTSPAQARAETRTLSASLDARFPRDSLEDRAAVIPIWQSPQGAATYMLPAILLMGAMSGLLLLVVCANVAGLVLVRALARHGEIAARLALGATRGRVVRLLLIETFVLALPGACVGLWLPRLVEPYLYAAQPSTVFLPLSFNFTFAPAALFAFVLACASAIVSGIVPAIRMSRVDLASAMKDGLSPRGSVTSGLRNGLVVLQVAMAVLLLVGTALVSRSLNVARRADTGFDALGVAAVQVDTISGGYDSADGRLLYRRLLGALRADPAIESATLMKDRLLMLMDFNRAEILPEGYVLRPEEDMTFLFNIVGTDHFRTLRIPLAAGRDFGVRDEEGAAQVAIVNETFARRFWSDPQAAVGKRVRMWDAWRTIVGVARDIKYTRLNEHPRPYLYVPHEQAFNGWMLVLARGRGDVRTVIEAVERHVRELDPNLPVLEAAPLADLTGLGVGVYDLTARSLGIIGVVAVALMSLGIYGLVAYTVQQSVHDTGIRLAVGAPRSHIVRRFMARGLVLGTTGAIVGIGASMTLTRLMADLLFGVSATDPLSFAGASGVVIGTAVLASLIPAWRGSRVDPVVALRHH